jgi:hypothetical protein
MILIIYFPFSKLIHAGGFPFSPTRYQRATFEERLLNPWDFSVAYHSENISTPEKYAKVLSGTGEEGEE